MVSDTSASELGLLVWPGQVVEKSAPRLAQPAPSQPCSGPRGLQAEQAPAAGPGSSLLVTFTPTLAGPHQGALRVLMAAELAEATT